MKLELAHLSVAYTGTPILRGLNAQVHGGEFIGLVGPNGSGKSCLLKTIVGILNPRGGSVHVDDRNVHNLGAKLRAQSLSYLAQDRDAHWPLPVRGLIALGRAPYRGHLGRLSPQDKLAIDNAVRAAYCTDLQDRRFDQLSGGEKMRVHLARALAVDAPLLIADEPTTALDPYYQISLMNTLSAQAQSGKTIITSLHDLSLAKQFCSRIWVLHEGALIRDSSPKNALGKDVLAQVFKVSKTNRGWVIPAP